jgi:N-acetylmuramoyl-L-alanine amidase
VYPRVVLVTLAAVCFAVLGHPSASAAGERASTRPANAPALENAATVSDARLGGDERRTRFIIDLSKNIEFFAFTLADPYRVVIDLPQIGFHLPPKTGATGRGLVKAFRFGLVMPGGSRIVLDAAGPVRIDKAFVLEAIDSQPARLVLDLVAVDRETFLRNLALQTKPAREGRPERKDDRESSAADPGDTRPVVVVDAGHGGLDGGTSAASGELEKAIVLEFALMLKRRLEKTGRVRVVMTRSDDSFVSLSERVRMTRAANASLFISIHADALARRDADTRGATVYTLSDRATDEEAARLADLENKADAIAGVDLSSEPNDIADILIDLTQRETRTFSTQFARTLVGELKTAARMHKHPMRSAGFKVLKAPDVPSILLELGYVSSPHDLKLMTSDAWRTRVADSITQAVIRFFAPQMLGKVGANSGLAP